MNKLFVLALFAACGGGDDSSDSTKIDAAKTADAAKVTDGSVTVDAAPATVTTVDCSTVTPAATVSTADGMFSYSPAATTVAQNGVVKFVMSSTHNVAPDTTGNTDSGLTVDFGATACLKFTAKGTFKFKCTLHGFSGTVTAN